MTLLDLVWPTVYIWNFCGNVNLSKHIHLFDFFQRKQYQLGKEIFDKYIASSTSAVKLERGIVKEMESFLLGNSAVSQQRQYMYLFQIVNLALTPWPLSFKNEFTFTDIIGSWSLWDGTEGSFGSLEETVLSLISCQWYLP